MFCKSLQRAIRKRGLVSPTSIQEKAIPLLLLGRNCLIVSPPGTGKTEAAVLPVFEMMIRRGVIDELGVHALYITPLRALNRDVFRRLAEIGEDLGISVGIRHGDTLTKVRKMQAEKPPTLLITTPETFQAILPGKRMRKHLHKVKWVIVDEIHELISDKRGVQLLLGLERLEEVAETSFQRIGLSATIGDPQTIASLLAGNGRGCKVVEADAPEKEVDVIIEAPQPSEEDLEQAIKTGNHPEALARLRRVVEIVNEHKTTLIFTNTREQAEALSSRLRHFAPHLRIAVHHGSLSREVRTEVEKQLRRGELRGVVCTSSLELGIDVGFIDYVIQYSSPRQTTKLVQRIGRSRHEVGGKPSGAILCAGVDDLLEAVSIAKLMREGYLEPPTLFTGALDVLAHQLLGLVLDHGNISFEKALAIVKRCGFYTELEDIAFENTIELLSKIGLLRVDWERRILRRTATTFRRYYENLSMIPDTPSYAVVDSASRKKVGSLDQSFVSEFCMQGQKFVLRGRGWRVVSVDDDQRKVFVEPDEDLLGAVPAWEGEAIPVYPEVAQLVGKLRRMLVCGEQPFAGVEVSPEVYEVLKHLKQDLLRGEAPLPDDRRVVVESWENYIIIHSCWGDRANEALGMLVGGLLASRYGILSYVSKDPYRVVLTLPHPLRPEVVVKELEAIKPEDVETLLITFLEDTRLLRWRLWHVAKRFGAVSKDLSYSFSRAQLLSRVYRDTPIFREVINEVFVDRLDLETVKSLLDAIQKGEMEVVAVSSSQPSPFATSMLERVLPKDVLMPKVSESELLEVVRTRLLREKVKLVCFFKGDWSGIFTVNAVPQRPRCPKCGSTLIAVTYHDDDATQRVIKKKVSGGRLSREEEVKWLRSWKSASLVQHYGKRAVLVLAARGVGPEAATRILRKAKSCEELLREVVRAERKYLSTRMFWRSSRGR